MKLLFVLHGWPPFHLAGTETYSHRLAKFLLGKGHEVRVTSSFAPHDMEYEGVKITQKAKSGYADEQHNDLFAWADLVLTSNLLTGYAINKSDQWSKKWVYFVHNQFEDVNVLVKVRNSYVVYNSQHCKDKIGYRQPSRILYPPVDYRDYKGVKGNPKGYVTLINHCDWKGGRNLIEIAKAMPDVKFLAIRGSYYEQLTCDLPNIEYRERTTDMKAVYRETALLLMPSWKESWGQTAIEAASCGIPTIASAAEGLKEALGPNGVFVERQGCDEEVPESITEKWVAAIRDALTPKRYQELSSLALKRAKELDPIPQLEEINEFFTWIHSRPYVD